MAKKSMILKQQAGSKFSSRRYNRCKICGRPHAYLRNYGVCRICFRELAYMGQITGVRKASWYAPGSSYLSVIRSGSSWEDGEGSPSRIPRIPPDFNGLSP